MVNGFFCGVKLTATCKQRGNLEIKLPLENLFRDVLNSTYNILPLSGLATLTGQRTLTVFEKPVSGKLEHFISNTFLNPGRR